MANRRLTDAERELLAPLLDEVRQRLRQLASGDEELHWAFRRRLFNQLQYDERLKPPYRAALKQKKRTAQKGLCNVCGTPLPDSYAILDRLEAMKGYTPENTQLLCARCDSDKQRKLGYT
jgi:5-methylcytosine-specific restriction endonuclease McrA